MRAVLKQTGLDRILFDMGREIAETLIEIFGDLSPDNPLMDNVDLMSPDDVDFFRSALRRVSGDRDISDEDRYAFQGLAFGYVEPRHRLGLLDETSKATILEGRERFRQGLESDMAQAVPRVFRTTSCLAASSTAMRKLRRASTKC